MSFSNLEVELEDSSGGDEGTSARSKVISSSLTILVRYINLYPIVRRTKKGYESVSAWHIRNSVVKRRTMGT